MSNSLAIATVTAALQYILQTHITMDGLKIRAGFPKAPVDNPTPEVSICLYRISSNPAFRNTDLPTRAADGTQVLKSPRVAIDLHYLLTCYGEEQQLIPQQLLAAVMEILHAHPILSRQQIKQAVATQHSFIYNLEQSDLADTLIEPVRLSWQDLPLEELTKMWSAFFQQIPYSLSIAYQASVVCITSNDMVVIGKPVKQRFIQIAPKVK